MVKRSTPAVITYYLQKDLVARIVAATRGVAPVNVHTSGRPTTVEEAVAGARKIYGQLLRESQVSFAGKDVLEVGPGDDLGIAMLASADGAKVTTLDRFAVHRDPDRLDALARAVGCDQMPEARDGTSLEDAAARFGTDSFDVIYSVAVLEHVGNLEAAFASLDRMLRPGGVMVHYIGGGAHAMFANPLTYLRVPRVLYQLMTAHSGGPNRVFPPDVRRLAEQHEWRWRIAVTQLIGQPFLAEPLPYPLDASEHPDQAALIERERQHFRQPFRSLPASDLMVEGCLLVARLS